jgi:hypothetical protein
MFIPDPDISPARTPDPKTTTKERGEKKFVVLPFLWPQIAEKNVGQFKKKYRTFYPQNCH